MSTQLSAQISAAVNSRMADTFETMDFMLAAESVRCHFAALAVSTNGEPDGRTPGQRHYATVLGHPRVDIDRIEHASERLLSDSVDPEFLKWSAKFLLENPSLTNTMLSDRLQELMTFLAVRSLAATELKAGKLMEVEEANRVKLDTALVRYQETMTRAKAKLTDVQASYDEAGRARCQAERITGEVDALTVRTGDAARRAIEFAWERHVKRARDSTRVRKPKPETVAAPRQDNGESK